MSGILPDGGIPPENAPNSLPRAEGQLAGVCQSLWYAPKCQPRFDPAAANAVISEIINVMQCANMPYDCTRLDNMCRAIRAMLTDLCGLPTVADPQPTDFVAGCFSGENGKTLISNLIAAGYSICSLGPHDNPILETDKLGGCFSDVDRTMTIAELRALLGGLFFSFPTPLLPNVFIGGIPYIPLAAGEFRYISGRSHSGTIGGHDGTRVIPGALTINGVSMGSGESVQCRGILHRKGANVWFCPAPDPMIFAADSIYHYNNVCHLGSVTVDRVSVNNPNFPVTAGGTWSYTNIGAPVAAPTP